MTIQQFTVILETVSVFLASPQIIGEKNIQAIGNKISFFKGENSLYRTLKIEYLFSILTSFMLVIWFSFMITVWVTGSAHHSPIDMGNSSLGKVLNFMMATIGSTILVVISTLFLGGLFQFLVYLTSKKGVKEALFIFSFFFFLVAQIINYNLAK